MERRSEKTTRSHGFPIFRDVRRAALALSSAVLLTLSSAGAAEKLALDAPLPTEIPPGTVLAIGDPVTQKALELSGELEKLPFTIKWANFSGGPKTLEAFRANALDAGAVADIPPIHGNWTGLQVRVIAASFRHDPENHPIYRLGTAPGVEIASLEDLRGKKIAYSPGQAQGALVLRILQKAGLTKDDVQLVEIPSTGDVYVNALASKLVDAAPIAEANQRRFLANYGPDGAKLILHGLRDDPWYTYVLASSLEDPAKAAAFREYVKAWGRALHWINTHQDEWVQGYYVKDQGLKTDDGVFLAKSRGNPDVPASWDDVLVRQQATIDLLAKETGKPAFPAAEIFDRRFETLAAEGFNEAVSRAAEARAK